MARINAIQSTYHGTTVQKIASRSDFSGQGESKTGQFPTTIRSNPNVLRTEIQMNELGCIM